MTREAEDTPVSASPALGVTSICHHTNFLQGPWGSNSGPHAYTARTLLTALSPGPEQAQGAEDGEGPPSVRNEALGMGIPSRQDADKEPRS